MNSRGLLFCLLLTPAGAMPQDLPPGVLAVSKVKARVREQMAHMPQYTCLETFERSHKFAGTNTKLEPQDTVRLEVLFSGGKEFFDSPGGRDFKVENPGAFVGSGAIGSGMFAGHVQTLFVNDQGFFTYRGEDSLAGHRALKWDFRVPLLQSRYTINMQTGSAEVAAKGSFWADPDTFDLIRLVVYADEIPAFLKLNDAITTMDYAHTRIGQDDVLLPQTGELRLLQTSGEESIARFEFTHCRSFQAAASISFSESDDVAAPGSAASAVSVRPAPVASPVTLPAGLAVTITLESAVTDRAAVGELIEGRVKGKVAFQGKTVIPDGAVVHGRIRRLEHSTEMGGYFTVGLEFTDIEAGGVSRRFFANLDSASRLPGLEWSISSETTRTTGAVSGQIQQTEIQRFNAAELPGVGTFFLRGAHFEIPKGWKMVWKTQTL